MRTGGSGCGWVIVGLSGSSDSVSEVAGLGGVTMSSLAVSVIVGRVNNVVETAVLVTKFHSEGTVTD